MVRLLRPFAVRTTELNQFDRFDILNSDELSELGK